MERQQNFVSLAGCWKIDSQRVFLSVVKSLMMSNGLISSVFVASASNSILLETHVGPDLRHRNCGCTLFPALARPRALKPPGIPGAE